MQSPFRQNVYDGVAGVVYGRRWDPLHDHAIYANEVTGAKHEQMGFLDGWGTVLIQLVEYIKGENL